MQAILDLLGKEALAAFLGGVVTMVLGFTVARWTFFRYQSKMKRGEFLGQVLVQSHALLPDNDGNSVLCFTTEKVYPDLSELFPNPALQKLFLERARATTEENPLMDLSGLADHAKRTLVSHLSSVVEGLEGRYIVLTTREAQDAVERKLTRVFLIKLDLLAKLRTWREAQRIRAERPPHWPRILNLHLAANRILDANGELIPEQVSSYGEIVFGPRIPLGSHAVDWEANGLTSGPHESPFRRG